MSQLNETNGAPRTNVIPFRGDYQGTPSPLQTDSAPAPTGSPRSGFPSLPPPLGPTASAGLETPGVLFSADPYTTVNDPRQEAQNLGGESVADYEDRYLGQLEKAIERIERTVERAVDRFQAQTERVEHHIKELHDAQEQRANRLESRFDNLQARMEGRMDQVLWAVIAFAATVLLGLIGEFYANTQVIGSILHHLP